MGFSLLADWAGKCIFEIDPAALERRGIRLLLADLDNTLVPYGVPEPTEEVRAWAAALAGRGVELFVLSNNRRPRRWGSRSSATRESRRYAPSLRRWSVWAVPGNRPRSLEIRSLPISWAGSGPE